MTQSCRRFAVFLALLTFFGCSGQEDATQSQYQPRERHYYLAAEDVVWNYAPNGDQMSSESTVPYPWCLQTTYNKTRYIEYTDESFTEKKPHPEHLGILGPIIRGVVGDVIKIHFKNNASRPYSIHPIGTRYTKANEGAAYAGLSFPGQAVEPGDSYTYTLEVTPETGPGPEDPSSILRLYRSHVDPVVDVYRGLVGPLIISRAETVNEDTTLADFDREFVEMFLVFDENGVLEAYEGEPAPQEPGCQSPNGEQPTDEELEEGHLMHAMNGYIFGNQPGLEMKLGERVRWYLFGMGSEVDLHTPHWHGNGVSHEGHRREVLMLLPSYSTVADMHADNAGTWMFKCNIGDHIHAGMMSLYTVDSPTKVSKP